MKNSFPIIAFLFTVQFLQAQPKAPVSRKFITDSIDNYVTNAMTAWKIPALSIAIVKDGQVVFMKDYGDVKSVTVTVNGFVEFTLYEFIKQ